MEASPLVGMFLAAFGHLPPVAGAVTQEVIDVLAVLNALRKLSPRASESVSQSQSFYR
jgi:cation transport ATPase